MKNRVMCLSVVFFVVWFFSGALAALEKKDHKVLDLSLLVASNLPCTWPAGWPFFQINHYLRIGPLSAYNSDILTIDPNTATQLDVPPHSVPRPDSKLPNAAPVALMFTDKVPPWQWVGEACVIDVRNLLDKAPNGHSPLILKSHIEGWEKKHRPLRKGDVVLFFSGYSDKYYQPFPAGQRFAISPLRGNAPAWPDPDPEAMEYLATRGVMTAGTDSPSMGPIPDLAEPTHLAGLKHGMVWTEGATGLGQLPPTGSFYCMLGPKHADDFASEARAFAIFGEPLASRLIESARKEQVIDLSVTLSMDFPVSWPGSSPGNHRQPYIAAKFMYSPTLDLFFDTHIMDSHTGTHLVPPAYALPTTGFDNRSYAPEVQEWLADYEKKYGTRGTSETTAEKVPLAQTCGSSRVINVNHLIGTTQKKDWPVSPEITPDHVRKYEEANGELRPGDVVVFFSGYTDNKCSDRSKSKACMADALQGASEGWPAPGPDTIFYLAGKGIRCVATDGPTLGGAKPRGALMTYWALGTKGMVAVEYLTNVGKLPKESYFVFAGLKISASHGGPGRAIALY